MKISEKIIYAVSSAVLSIFILFVLIYGANYFIACSALKKISFEKDFECARFIIYGSSEKSVSARIELLDSQENSFCEIERSWPSDSIYFEFVNFSYKDKTISFPNRIYSSNNFNIQSGVMLGKYVLKNTKNNSFINKCAVFAMKPSARAYPCISYNEVSLAGCVSGKLYSIILKTDSSIEISLID